MPARSLRPLARRWRLLSLAPLNLATRKPRQAGGIVTVALRVGDEPGPYCQWHARVRNSLSNSPCPLGRARGRGRYILLLFKFYGISVHIENHRGIRSRDRMIVGIGRGIGHGCHRSGWVRVRVRLGEVRAQAFPAWRRPRTGPTWGSKFERPCQWLRLSPSSEKSCPWMNRFSSTWSSSSRHAARLAGRLPPGSRRNGCWRCHSGRGCCSADSGEPEPRPGAAAVSTVAHRNTLWTCLSTVAFILLSIWNFYPIQV